MSFLCQQTIRYVFLWHISLLSFFLHGLFLFGICLSYSQVRRFDRRKVWHFLKFYVCELCNFFLDLFGPMRL